VAVDVKVFVVEADLAVELPLHRVPLDEVGEGLVVGEVVDRDDVLDLLLGHRAHDVAPDPPEAVDSDFGHGWCYLLGVLFG
jgi:hypothetical protein